MQTGVVKRGFENAKQATLVKTVTDNGMSRPESHFGGFIGSFMDLDIENQQEVVKRSNKRLRRWVGIALGCTVAAVLFASVNYVLMDVLENVKPKPHLLFVWWATRFYLWAALSPAVVGLLRRFPLQPIAAARVFVHFIASLVFSLIHMGLHMSLAVVLIGRTTLSGGPSSLVVQFVHSYPLGVLAYWVIIVIVNTTDHYERIGVEQLRSSKLQAQLAEARLRTLQMQLQPHFVFNALHSLSDLVTEEPKTAVRLIARLGDFLRLTLQNSTAQGVPLKRELDFLDAYLEIERVRFGDRLKVVFEIDPQSLDAEVPSLILQPLVENAIRHGVASHIGPGLVQLVTKRRGLTLLIEIRDNGPGMPTNAREGLGLRNTHERLRQTYGLEYSLEVRNQGESGVVVSCELPYRQFAHEETPSNP
jgi:two-component system LytT family sensor kinase